jgi:tRNA pseudouridine-54 N-methylase
MFSDLPQLGMIVYSYGFGLELPQTYRQLASHKARMDIVARILLAFMYAGLSPGPRCDRFIITVVEGVREGPVAAIFRCQCLPKRITHLEAYRIVHSTVVEGSTCYRDVLGFEEAVKLVHSLGYRVLLLREDGVPLEPSRLADRQVYVLGTAVDPPRLDLPMDPVSVGPLSYHADQVAAYISLLHDIVLASLTGLRYYEHLIGEI